MTPIAEGNPGRGKHPFRQSHPTPRDHRRSRGVDGDPKRTGVFRPAHVTRVGRVHLDHAHAEARRAGVDHGLEQAVGERAQPAGEVPPDKLPQRRHLLEIQVLDDDGPAVLHRQVNNGGNRGPKNRFRPVGRQGRGLNREVPRQALQRVPAAVNRHERDEADIEVQADGAVGEG